MMIDRRSAAARPGRNVGSCCIGIRFREIDGDNPINFDDHLSEEHAKAIVDLIHPLLYDEWKIHATHDWGNYVVKNDGWDEEYIVAVSYLGGSDLRITVRPQSKACTGPFKPRGISMTVPLEQPNTIELMAQFVFEQLRSHAAILINRPIVSATEERKEQPSSKQGPHEQEH